MKGEPQWGQNRILQLNWVFDEYFTTPESWTTVFKEFRVAYQPVLNTKGTPLETVVQLDIQTDVGIVAGGLPGVKCATCGRTKYLPVVRGPFPELAERPSDAIVKTKEYFGSGKQADRRVLVSRDLADRITAHCPGVSLRPVAEVTDAK
jgi:hypothetical protein